HAGSTSAVRIEYSDLDAIPAREDRAGTYRSRPQPARQALVRQHRQRNEHASLHGDVQADDRNTTPARAVQGDTAGEHGRDRWTAAGALRQHGIDTAPRDSQR